MHVPMPGIEVTTVSAVMQKGVRLNDRVLRPARVGVANRSDCWSSLSSRLLVELVETSGSIGNRREAQ